MTTTAAGKNGHAPTLIASFLHFDLSFMIWVMLGALGNYIAESLGLGSTQKGIMVAVPILTGSLLRIPLGVLSDRIGGKRVGIALLIFLFIPLIIGWQFVENLPALIAVGLMLGTAGASFAVALPLASKWYPAERQGLVMGIAAAGNSGTVVANLSAPKLAGILGWENVLALAMIPLAVVLIAFLLMAKDHPGSTVKQPIRDYFTALKEKDLWWFCLIYSVTFGGYVGLSSFLPIFFRDEYGISKVNAGYLTALAAFVGSGIRPFGGFLADRLGGIRMLSVLLVVIGAIYMLIAQIPPIGITVCLLLIAMVCLGMGNGATFQAVPQRFRKEIGVATGVIGALGGLGGFFLPILLSMAKVAMNSFAAGFLLLSLVSCGVAALLWVLMTKQYGWKTAWRTQPAQTLMATTALEVAERSKVANR